MCEDLASGLLELVDVVVEDFALSPLKLSKKPEETINVIFENDLLDFRRWL